MSLAKPRKPQQIIIDRYLTLTGFRIADKKGWMGATKTQKYYFYAEYLMSNRSERAFNLLFRRLNFGPYSDDLESDLKYLTSVNLLNYESNGFVLDDLGDRVLADTKNFFKDNSWVLERMAESAKKIAPMNTEDTLKFIYQLPLKTAMGERVGDVADGGTIIKPLDEKCAEKKIVLDEDWLETLEILLDTDCIRRLYYLVDNPRKSKLIPFVVD